MRARSFTVVLGLAAAVGWVSSTESLAQSVSDRGRPVILLVHGRGMLDRDSAVERREWTAALDDGARAAMHAVPFDGADVRVVWYADVLDPRSAAGCDYAADDPRARRDARSDAAMKDLISIAGGLLGALSDAVSDSESSGMVRGLAADASFLSDARRRCAAEQRLGAALDRARSEGRPVVLVAHSLGSVVAYDYLSARADTGLVQRFVTIGSPLGAPDLRHLLIGGDSTDRLEKPSGVRDWINLRHVDDQLAMPLTVARDSVVPLPPREADPHELVGYLRGSAVAAEILNAWCGAFGADRPHGCNGLLAK